jgi:hypothetical protein
MYAMKVMKSIIFILISLIVLSVLNVQAQASSPFCASSADNQNYEWIVRVQIHDGVQNSGKSGYSDYTDTPLATLTAGTTYNVEVDVATNGTQYHEYVKIWFDMNQNDAIEDPAELVFNVDKNVQTLGTFSGTVTVPSTAFNGHIYVRVIMQYNATPALCGTYTYGETEDYLVNVIGATPNPENNTLTVATAGSGTGDVTSSPSGINTAGGVNSFDFSENEVVTLTATPTAGSSFTNWTGDCSGTNTSVAVTMDADKNCTAYFGTGITEPTVATTAASSITTTTAQSGGNVTSDGGASVTARGVCWSTSANPTTADAHTTDGTGTGTFTSSLTGLTAGATYYVRAYATNTAGTAYGNEVSFTTRATTTSTVADGNWSSTSTWSGGLVPLSVQSVTISNNVTLDTTAEVNGLTISADKTLTFSSTNTLTVNGSATISGTMNVAGGSCNVTGASAVTGTLTIGTGTYTANDSFDATGGNVTFTGAGTLNLAGTVACGGLGTFTKATGCTVDYKLNGAQSVSAVDYYHLKLGTGGTKILCGHLTSSNSAGIDGDLTIAGEATLDVSESNYNIEIAGNWTNNWVFTAQAGTVAFDGSEDSMLVPGGSSFYALVLNKDASDDKLSPQTSSTLTVSSALTITKGTFNLANGDALTADVNLSLGGALSIGATGLWTKSNDTTPKTVTFTGDSCTLTDNSTEGPQNLGHVVVGLVI